MLVWYELILVSKVANFRMLGAKGASGLPFERGGSLFVEMWPV